ncbi:unnamed protein product [Parnassius apollo]|uniref:(apollo) hypothetical protein n=1 Tax=Parnassius apollo TaxID=110799 RepID=A0A8S3WHB9_PARAO|nr:unnamed protein product [Parnassius apollo]
MLRSPADKQINTYGSAPTLLQNNDGCNTPDNSTLRSTKRRRCECDCASTPESKLDVFINSLTSWKHETDVKLSGIMESINEIKQLSSDLLASNSEIEKSIEFLSCKYDEICGELKNVHSQNMIYGDRLSKLENTTEEIERFSRSSSIEIRNLPIKLPLSQDDQVVIACRIFSELSTKVQTSDIYDIRCLPSKQDTKTVPVTLNSVILKKPNLEGLQGIQ